MRINACMHYTSHVTVIYSAMAEILFNGKRLDELKVVEIREELGKRGLSRKGIKSALIKRFEKALLQERLDQEIPRSGETEDEANCTLKTDEWMSEEGLETSELKHEDAQEEDLSQHVVQKDKQVEFGTNDSGLKPYNSQEEIEGEDPDMEVSYEERVERTSESVNQTADDGAMERLESVTSIIEPSFPKDEELIYEGDVDNDEIEYANQVEMDVDDEEDDKDELIVDFTAGELDLDPRPSEERKSASKPFPNNDKTDSKPDTSKVYSEDSSEERCNLWVSGLSQLVSASDLKTLFSPYGQVISAKVVARAKSTKNQRYGFVTMASPEQAEKSIQNLNSTELKGQMITVELTKSSPFVSKQKKEEESAKDSTSPTKNGSAASDSKQTTLSKSLTSSDAKNKANSKNDSNKSSGKGSGSAEKSTSGKRIIAVEKTDGRKELYTTSGKRRRDEQRGDNKRNRGSRSPQARNKSPGARARSRSPRARRRTSPRGRIVSHRMSPVRRIGGPLRRGISPPLHRRPLSPPVHRRMPSPPPMHRRLPSPPIRRSGGNDDVRRDLMRREMERRELERRDIRNRLGGRIAPPPPAPPPVHHEMEMRLEEQRRRMITERERERVALRREMEMEHARKEQELARQMQEIQQREERDRSMLERQQREFIQLQRTIKERESHIEAKEREIRDKEIRERQRLEALERQKEKDIREKEKRYRDQLERDLKEREIIMQKEQEALRLKLKEQERMLLDRERQIRAEQEQLARAREDVERKQRRKDEDEKERDREREREKERKDRDNRRSGHMKDDKDREDKDRLSKRNVPSDEGIFGRLGNRDGQSQDSGPRAAIVKETQISPNVMYRRIESSGAKPVVNRAVSNPYSQNQSRSKALDSLSTNYATPRHSNNPVGYPQPSRYSSAQYAHNNSQSVGYGGSSDSSSGPSATNMSQFNSSIQSSKISNLLNNPDLLNALTNVARSSNISSGGGGSSSFSGMGGNFGSNMGGGSSVSAGSMESRYYGSGSSALGGSQGRPGGFAGMGMTQSQFTKHMNKMPQEPPDRYSRRIPPRPDPYSHFKRM